MSSVIKPIRKLQDKTTPGFLKPTQQLDLGRQAQALANPKLPELPNIPTPPTIDQAQQNRDQQDRLRRRRGVLANIYAGGKTSLGG